MGIYDQLEQLNKPSPSPKATVGLPTAPKMASHVENQPPNVKSQKTPVALVTQESTSELTREHELSRDRSSDNSREKLRDLPSRDEIQEFSFQLRDELKVKVQAEVPHKWQDELEAIARELDVKKLELYRFILGEFLGKVRRKKNT